jgi:hypothetical protein
MATPRDGVTGPTQFSDPAYDAVAITPNDSTVLSGMRAIYVGVGGDISVATPTGNVTFVGVPQGTILPVAASKVRSTGTTATTMVGLY